ncbi:MAG TPA: alpha-amylase family glycosyl hydrolase, partial [Clostridia bacterium]|nr:alpha-amylase family glycosyl hydrolase [Clostridia bacterium]
TWAAAERHLPALADLGITVVHVMPVGEFPGTFGWGYDGVDLFAPTRLYGRPDDFRAFVNAAHGAGLGVILDVVYNHLGPDGNYLKHFSKDYFTNRYKNEWGEAVNFDGHNSSPVRDFFLANAAYWIREFHLDGLRLDATQQIFDASANHFMGALSRVVREAGDERAVYLVVENEPQEAKLLRPFEAGGYGLDAMWNDDFHHSTAVALTGRTEAYYMDYRGTPQELISATKRGFLYQGQFYVWQQKPRGSPALDIPIEQCIHYLQNHDQVANSLRGWRMHQLASAARCRALTALLLLGPATPMLFQGQEFWASAPFLYFADHTPALAALVARGRADFVRQFPSVQCAGEEILDRPEARDTFLKCKLDLEERHRHAAVRRLHQDLLRLRREDPALGKPHLDGAVLGDQAFVLRFFGAHQQDRLLLVNLGKDATLSTLPEPLLAPVGGMDWQVHWSSEAPDYGGSGMRPINTQGQWRLTAESAVVLAPGRSDERKGKENR